MEKIKNTVCAVVVTYNRKNLLIECLEALKNQTKPLDGIYLIDNASTDKTPELLLEKGYINKPPPENLSYPWEKTFYVQLSDGKEIPLHYVRMNVNLGGAGGFYEGVKRGYERGYDWLWLMDDDAEPYPDAVEKIFLCSYIKDTVAFASLKISKSGEYPSHRGYFDFKNALKPPDYAGIIRPIEREKLNNRCIEIDHASFVGILISRYGIEKVGFPKKELFIYYDDVEYCYRLRQIGKIVLVMDSKILHKEASQKTIAKSFRGRISYREPYEILWLYYFKLRNRVWIGFNYGPSKIVFIGRVIKFLFRKTVGILLYDDHKLKRIGLIFNACIDGILGNFNNEKPINKYKPDSEENS